MTSKKCPICLKEKSLDQFYKYFSKPRNKYRVSNYCITCGRANSKKRVKEYYQKNQEKRKQYSRDYRRSNPEKIKALSSKFSKKYTEELKECYVAEQAAKALKCSIKDIRENPSLLEAYKINLKLKRKIRSYGTK